MVGILIVRFVPPHVQCGRRLFAWRNRWRGFDPALRALPFEEIKVARVAAHLRQPGPLFLRRGRSQDRSLAMGRPGTRAPCCVPAAVLRRSGGGKDCNYNEIIAPASTAVAARKPGRDAEASPSGRITPDERPRGAAKAIPPTRNPPGTRESRAWRVLGGLRSATGRGRSS